jgi:hypothetical protein
MQFALGALSVLSIVLLAVIKYGWTKFNQLNLSIDGLYKEIRDVNAVILNLPPTNIIHLGLKDGRISSGLAPTTLTIRPEDFQINADKLYTELCVQLESTEDREMSIRAYSLLNRAGLENILDSKSRREADAALTRLFINGDTDGAKKFLRVLADSINQAQAVSA